MDSLRSEEMTIPYRVEPVTTLLRVYEVVGGPLFIFRWHNLLPIYKWHVEQCLINGPLLEHMIRVCVRNSFGHPARHRLRVIGAGYSYLCRAQVTNGITIASVATVANNVMRVLPRKGGGGGEREIWSKPEIANKKGKTSKFSNVIANNVIQVGYRRGLLSSLMLYVIRGAQNHTI